MDVVVVGFMACPDCLLSSSEQGSVRDTFLRLSRALKQGKIGSALASHLTVQSLCRRKVTAHSHKQNPGARPGF
jgi:hypothetical protein